jgi:iron complex transport system ATP-binding protein
MTTTWSACSAHQGAPHEAATHAALQQVFQHRLSIFQVRDRWVALNA